MQKKTWIDNMIYELGTAYKKSVKQNYSQQEREKNINLVAQKYFKPGMPKNQAFELLNEMKENGFHISESRHEGAILWPTKILKTWESAQHPDEETIKSLKLHYQPGISYFHARKMIGRYMIIVENYVGISFIIKDKDLVVSDVEADLWANAI